MVNVSGLRDFEFCPRAVYLKEFLKLTPELSPQQARGLVGHAIRKELSLRQSKLLKKIKHEDQLGLLLQSEFDCILDDLPYIYKEKLAGIELGKILGEIEEEINSEIGLISSKLAVLVKEQGLQQALKAVTPWKTEYPIRSEALNLTGIVDKIMQPLSPVEIKTGKVGESVWEGDRMQLCAYGMLLEEKFQQEILQGFVEYTRVQEQRQVLLTERLRRRVLDTRDKVTEILSGNLPEICPHGNGKKCDACSFKKECYTI